MHPLARVNRELARLNSGLVNLIAGLIGVVLVLVALLVAVSSNGKTILLSVGTAIIASALFAYISSHYLFRESRLKEMMDIWKISAIYHTRSEMNASSNLAIQSCTDRLDVIAFGLRGFRDSQGDLIASKVSNGLKIRVLVLDPESSFVAQRETDEKEVTGQIKKTIEDLIAWISRLRNRAKEATDVDIRVYQSLPLDFYFRIDDSLFIGPYLHGITSQQTISYEFGRGEAFTYWTAYFEKLWEDDTFCQSALQ